MAYAAVISLKQTILRLACSQAVPIFSGGEILQFPMEEMLSLQEVLERLDSSVSSISTRLDDLDGEINKAVNKLADLLEFHESDLQQQSDQSHGYDGCSLLSEEARQQIDSVTEGLKKMKEEYIKELEFPSADEDGNRMKSSKMVGYIDYRLTKIGDHHSQRSYHEFSVFSLAGMAGTGRTILARSFFDDPDIRIYFERRAWVTVGPDYQEKEIIQDILSQIYPPGNYELPIHVGGGEKLIVRTSDASPEVRSKCLIVLDGVRDIDICESVRSLFPSDKDNRILLTTSLGEAALSPDVFNIYTMSILNKEQSWYLLRRLVFAQELCPPELEQAGKKIAENYGGLSVEIVKVALFLSKADKTLQLWNKVTEETRKTAVKDASYDEMSEIPEITKDMQLGYSFRGGDENDVFSRTDSARIITEVLGLSHAIDFIKMNLFPIQRNRELEIISLFGMAGIGKTTRARRRFEDSSSYFDHRVWVTLGPKYRPERILVDILGQIDPDINKMRTKGAEILHGKKCLIVLDDVWSKSPLQYLNNLFPGTKFEIWLTTRLKEVAQFAKSCDEMPLLNEEESWRLLREQVFAEEPCPPELEKAGKIIADNCDGLPLMIVTVASFLTEANTLDYWNKVAKKENSVFEDANDKILEVLYPSYQYLPQHLKPCFLYMGVFPQKYEIPTSKLFKLWNYDRILEPKWSKTVENDAMEYLEKLVSQSLLVVGKKNYNSRIKTCRLHSVFWYLCMKEARRNKFFHVLNSYVDGLAEDMESQRRLCIHNNILFGIKATHDSMAAISTARSLLCTGTPHEYPVLICLGLRLLRVLDALTIRVYEFPIKALNLVNLTYLTITYNGKLPSSISKLKNLECLIVHRHLCTLLYGAPLYLPMEIWDMHKLKHLQAMGSNLPDPCGALLPNLLFLLDVSADSCTKGVLQGTRNLRKLGIRIEIAPYASEPLFSFDVISHLDRLESLKCVVVNPELGFEVIPPPAPLSMLTSGLIKLSLSGFGYPWKYMRTIALIPFLEVLKLRCYAFRGPKWIMQKGEFKSLRYLLLEDNDLVCWRADDGCFPLLQHLMIRHCYKLEVIPAEILRPSCRIELVGCNPFALKQIQGFNPENELAHVLPSL